MNISRREFLFGAAAFGLGGWRLFAAPPGWKPHSNPNIVFGVLADTHLRISRSGGYDGRNWPDKYLVAALEHFRAQNVDAVVHCGDMADRGVIAEMQFHADAWRKVFPDGCAADGRKVKKLFINGNHDVAGGNYGKGFRLEQIWPDPEERAKHLLSSDMAGNWERIWGEKYEPVWHKEVKGYHFFGRHWNENEYKHTGEKPFADYIRSNADVCSLKGTKPFFILSHRRHHFFFCQALKDFPNAVAFMGHWHQSNADWKSIYFDRDTFGGFFPHIQVGACRYDGQDGMFPPDEIKLQEDSSSWKCDNLPSRQAMIVNVFDDMVVFERHEVGQGGKLGPDWVMPLGEFKPHPFSRAELAKTCGTPEFGKKAKLEVSLKEPALCVKIPMADGNPDSRVYAYEMVVVGDDPKAKLFKNAFFEGVNAGIGHEPKNGITEVKIPAAELPVGKKLTIAVRPVSSLGTKGKAIAAKLRT